MSSKDIYTINYANSTLLSPVESQILTQYQLLASQLNNLSSEIKQLNSANTNKVEDGNADKLLDNLRNLEMKIGLVYTLFKGAVYSLFLQHEEDLNLQNDRDNRKVDSPNAVEFPSGNITYSEEEEQEDQGNV
ncbi:DASH complex subunit Dad3p [[Candida] anglica]|uniref:DASH complex subunit DAD3 n=1 Tax=[Candida] anglica TaxID=148631 RepID=A0ABP0EP24_9ASCO